MSKEIKNVYLMWVGSQHYPKIADYVAEAMKMGISKRLPNAAAAAKLTEPGATIFIAHDEGETEPCPKCPGKIQNPDYRKAHSAVERQARRADRIGTNLIEAHESDDEKLIARLEREYKRETGHIETRKQEAAETTETIDGTTGGTVLVDGEVWDYRRYNYWIHQPAKFKADERTIEGHEICEHCGGTGVMPLGKVFGMALPSAVEYIMRPEDSDKVRKEMEERGFRIVNAGLVSTELKRGCGVRKHGGFYAVSDEESKKETQAAIERLVKAGVIDGETTNRGDFVEFLKPVDIPGVKRFRGIKSWTLESDVEDEAEMIMEAM